MCRDHVIAPTPFTVGKVLLVLLIDQQILLSPPYKSDPAFGPGDTSMNKATWANSLQGLRILAFASLAELSLPSLLSLRYLWHLHL